MDARTEGRDLQAVQQSLEVPGAESDKRIVAAGFERDYCDPFEIGSNGAKDTRHKVGVGKPAAGGGLRQHLRAVLGYVPAADQAHSRLHH